MTTTHVLSLLMFARLEDELKQEREIKEQLLAALIDLLPHAERNIADLNSQMVGTLYPGINEAKLRRAEAAIAKAKGTT